MQDNTTKVNIILWMPERGTLALWIFWRLSLVREARRQCVTSRTTGGEPHAPSPAWWPSWDGAQQVGKPVSDSVRLGRRPGGKG